MNRNDLVTLKAEVEQATDNLKLSVDKLEGKLSATLQQVSSTAERTIDHAKDFLRELNPVRQMRKYPMIGFSAAVAAGAVVVFRQSRRAYWENRLLEQVSGRNGQPEVRYARPAQGTIVRHFAQAVFTSVATAVATEIARRSLKTQNAEPESYSVH